MNRKRHFADVPPTVAMVFDDDDDDDDDCYNDADEEDTAMKESEPNGDTQATNTEMNEDIYEVSEVDTTMQEEATVTRANETSRDDAVDNDIRAFFTSPVVSSSDVELVGPSVTRALEEVVQLMETKKPALYSDYKANSKKDDGRSDAKKSVNDDGSCEEEYDPSRLEGIDPRTYQMALLNIAKKKNTIVHLGTGTG
jgi:hypothetical protein